MRLFAIATLLTLLAVPALGAVMHDESVDGDLSSDPNFPTLLFFAVGGNTISGTISNSGIIDRDYITFTVGAGQVLSGLILHVFTPDNLGFAAFNAGSTSYVPSATTAADFLAGIHASGSDVGTDLMPLFVSSSVTGNSLADPQLGPGTYSFLIQQTNNILQSYSLEFVISAPVGTEETTWSAIKALYR